MLTPEIVRSVSANRGLNKSQANAITNTDIVIPATSAIRKEASAAIEPSMKPISGIHLRTTMRGVKIKYKPPTARIVPRKRKPCVEKYSLFSWESKYFYAVWSPSAAWSIASSHNKLKMPLTHMHK